MSRAIRAVVGTAGHVDHGKTTLIQHLTGIDTDRLKEEKARGISIELGFAWADLEEGRVAVVDVPGHERFVRQMIAGAAGIDIVLLVVAADEGVMPQTHEHLDICQLLGVRTGGVVITKTDLVDEEWLELVQEDVAEAVTGTFLEGAPVTTYARGDEEALAGVRGLISALVGRAEAAGELASRAVDRPFKLSVDRVFSMRGFGTVVTGTTGAGRLATGDAVVVLPSGLKARVRGLQQHGETTQEITAGARVAVNLQGVDHGDLHRGDVVTSAAGLVTTSMFDATCSAPARLTDPLPDRTRVLVHVGTAQIEGTLAWMGDREALLPGETAPAQIRLDHPTSVLPGESFIARGFTVLPGYGKTVAGGRVLCPVERRHRRRDTREVALVEALAGGDVPAMIEALAAYEGQRGLPQAGLSAKLPAERAAITEAIEDLLASGGLVLADGALYHASILDVLAPKAVAIVAEHHQKRPAWPGVAFEELRTRIREGLPADLLTALLGKLAEAGSVRISGEVVALPDFSPKRSPAQLAACDAIAGRLRDDGLMPTRVQDLPDALDLDADAVTEALDLLLMDEAVVRVNQGLFFDASAMTALQASLVAYLREHGTIDTGAFKTLTGASRKWTIPLGEYFDRIRLTLRVGDARRLRADA